MKKIIAEFILAGFFSITACDQPPGNELAAWRDECFRENAAMLVKTAFSDPIFHEKEGETIFSDSLNSLLANTILFGTQNEEEKENALLSSDKIDKIELLRIGRFLYSFNDEKLEERKKLAMLFFAHALDTFHEKSNKSFRPITFRPTTPQSPRLSQ